MNGVGVTNAWKMLIKPERVNYSEDCLGPQLMELNNCNSKRVDFCFINNRGNRVQCSLFTPQPIGSNEGSSDHSSVKLDCPVVVYCHSQSGNRVEGLFLQRTLLEEGCALCLFDFAGCGKSEGEYVTLGWREADDLEQLVQLLTHKHSASRVVIWGRSMGAVTALHFARRNSFLITSMV